VRISFAFLQLYVEDDNLQHTIPGDSQSNIWFLCPLPPTPGSEDFPNT
jgi:hypothetical protein